MLMSQSITDRSIALKIVALIVAIGYGCVILVVWVRLRAGP